MTWQGAEDQQATRLDPARPPPPGYYQAPPPQPLRGPAPDTRGISPLVPVLVILGAIVLLLDVAILFLGPVVAPYEPNAISISARLQGPTADHLLGTDNVGRDILSRKLYGAHAPGSPLVIAARDTTSRRIIALIEMIAVVALVIALVALRRNRRGGRILGILAALVLVGALAHVVSVVLWNPTVR